MTRIMVVRTSAILAFCLFGAVLSGSGALSPTVGQAQTVLKVGVPESMPLNSKRG